MGEPGLRPVADADGGHVAGKLSGTAADAGPAGRDPDFALLAAMVQKTIFAISAEESRFTLNGALLLFKSDGLTMVATDGHRLALVESEVPLPSLGAPYKALLPRKAMQELVKLSGDAGEGACSDSRATKIICSFEIGERLLISRKLTGNFPDYERVLPKDQPNIGDAAPRRIRGRRSSAWLSSPTSVRERSGCSCCRVSSRFIRLLSETGESEETISGRVRRPADRDRLQCAVHARFSARVFRGERIVPFP